MARSSRATAAPARSSSRPSWPDGADAPLAGRGRRGLLLAARRRLDGLRVLAAGRTRESCARWTRRPGAERWQAGYDAPYTPSPPTAAHGSGPKATPLAHEGKVFTLGISGILAAFDGQTGKLLWRTEAPAEAPYFSAASSPLGVPGLVIVHPGQLRGADRVRRLVGRGEVEDRGRRILHVADAGDAAGRAAGGVGDAGRRDERHAVRRPHAVGLRVARRQAGRHHAHRARRPGGGQRRGLRCPGPPSRCCAAARGRWRRCGKRARPRCTSATRWWWTRRCTGSRPGSGGSSSRWTCATGTRAGSGRRGRPPTSP